MKCISLVELSFHCKTVRLVFFEVKRNLFSSVQYQEIAKDLNNATIQRISYQWNKDFSMQFTLIWPLFLLQSLEHVLWSRPNDKQNTEFQFKNDNEEH